MSLWGHLEDPAPIRGSTAAPAPITRRELWARARALGGRSLGDLADALGLPLPQDPARSKGYVGRLTELALGADPTALERPDFPHLGVELKTVPIGPNGRPQQSTFVCSINLAQACDAQWPTSRLRQRLQTVLLMPFEPAAQPQHHRFLPPLWWQPTPEAWTALEGDWEDLMGAIGAGRGASLSAREGKILQVRPKAANARVRTLGPAEDGLQAMLPLGFYLRARFVHQLLTDPQNAVGPDKGQTFEDGCR
jgi:DNA mismatch repair protein MutH